jgi:hypothetical protein
MIYNCCTNGLLPDMSDFTHLEVSAVYAFSDGDETNCEAIHGVASGNAKVEDYVAEPDESKLMYTVYGRLECGEVEPLHDESTLDAIMAVANDLSARFGLELEVR